MNILIYLHLLVLSFAVPLVTDEKNIANKAAIARDSEATDQRGPGGGVPGQGGFGQGGSGRGDIDRGRFEHGGFGRGGFGHGGFGHGRGGFGHGDFWGGRFHDRARWMMDRRRLWGPGRALWFNKWNLDRGVCGRVPRVGNVAAISYEYMPVACGQCIAVRRGPNVEKAIVVDSCPECGPNEVRINGGGFGMFKRMFGSSHSVDWQFVPC